jgi:alcohol dehydrogenase class IV
MAEFICDIFAHSVEAYISRLTSPLIMDLAEMNVLKLIDNWKSYLEDPENLNILGKIAMNGQIGGICQGNAFVGVMHALTHQIELLTGLGHSRILLNIIRPVLEWYSKNSDLEICEVFMKQFDELKLEEYRENILEDVDLEKLAIKSLEDPSIKTSPVIFNEDKIRGLIKWISTKK